MLQEITGFDGATYFPKTGELVYVWNTDPTDGSDYVLAWRYEIQAYKPTSESFEVFINAHNGTLVKIRSLLDKCGQSGTCNTLYNGSQTIEEDYRGGLYNDYVLNDCSDSRAEIETRWKDWHGITNKVTNGGANWGNSDQNPTTSHWSAMMARNYWWDTWGRRSIDGGAMKMAIFVDLNDENAYFDQSNNFITVGKESSNDKTWGSLDLLGHEWTHGVVKYTAHLQKDAANYAALNESFGDIFGTLTQKYATGTIDWVLGEDVHPVRDMSNPAVYSHPYYYHGTNWYSGTDIETYSHTNAGVQNNWFYRLYNYLGLTDASKITYKNLTENLTSTATYTNARTGSIQAAKALFGTCSPQVNKTITSWSEVGVGSGTVDPQCVSISGIASACTSIVNQTVSYHFTASANTTPLFYVWTVTCASAVQYNVSPNNTLTITKFVSNNPVTILVEAYWSTFPVIKTSKTK